jgi:hypothetical protein
LVTFRQKLRTRLERVMDILTARTVHHKNRMPIRSCAKIRPFDNVATKKTDQQFEAAAVGSPAVLLHGNTPPRCSHLNLAAPWRDGQSRSMDYSAARLLRVASFSFSTSAGLSVGRSIVRVRLTSLPVNLNGTL